MPGAVWFPGRHAELRRARAASPRRRPAIVARSQTRDEVVLSWAELADQVARAAAGCGGWGSAGRPGRRLPAQRAGDDRGLPGLRLIGAIWSSCAPEFGTRAVVDRVQQIEPKVLLVVDGYRYGTKDVDRATEVAEIRAALPTLRGTVLLPYLDPRRRPGAVPGRDHLGRAAGRAGRADLRAVPFDHPLYVLYSSGTTGLPKAIVHGHGGILLEHLKMLGLHHDLGRTTGSAGSPPPGG
jgi:acetoacetyl-CoA synthetase